MKKKDLPLFIVVGVFSAIISVVVSNFLITPKQERTQKAEVVEAISTDFKQPDSKYFNENSINPTKRIQIGDDANTTPFNGAR